MKKHRRLRTALLIVLGVLALCMIGVMIYAGDAYAADDAALVAMASTASVTVMETGDGIAFIPAEPAAGFIFYPGGKVEHTAYAPLMQALAEEGVLCVLVEMPLNLAVLDMDAAAGIPGQYPQVSRWYIGGHSLGGAMAASHAAANPENFAGLALLAAYATQPVPASLAVVSITATADAVLNWEQYEACLGNLPATAQQISIPGGNHAQFGSYGPQEGDGTATITPAAQLHATVASLLDMMLSDGAAEAPQ